MTIKRNCPVRTHKAPEQGDKELLLLFSGIPWSSFVFICSYNHVLSRNVWTLGRTHPGLLEEICIYITLMRTSTWQKFMDLEDCKTWECTYNLLITLKWPKEILQATVYLHLHLKARVSTQLAQILWTFIRSTKCSANRTKSPQVNMLTQSRLNGSSPR